ncbi:MAG: hypothetical protein ACLFNM_00210 [Candidatus Woesearchaeota archaeon]
MKQKLCSKKANIGVTKLVIIIIALIGFGLLVAIIFSTHNSINSLEEEQLCHAMLGVQDFTNRETALANTKVQNTCQTMRREISQNSRTPQQIFSEISNYIAQTSWVIGHGNYPDLWGDYDFFRNSECGIVYEIQIPKTKIPEEMQSQMNYLSLDLYLNSTLYKTIDDFPYTYADYVMHHPDTKIEHDVLLAPFYAQEKKEIVKVSSQHLQEKNLSTNQFYAISVMSIDSSSRLANILGYVFTGVLGKVIIDDFRVDTTIIWFSTLEEAISSGCVYLNEQDTL